MTATRSTKEEYQYRKQRRTEENKACPFCNIKEHDPQFVEETGFLKVIRNRVPYSIWDGQGVVDHLMIVPKVHTDKLGSLGTDAAIDYIDIVTRYESKGYNLYARAPSSNVKSVFHQHTHLIRLDDKERRFLVLLRKPFYIRLSLK